MNRFEKKDLDAVAYRLVQAMNKETPSMPADPYDPASSKTKLWLDELVETTKKRHKRVMRALRTGAVVISDKKGSEKPCKFHRKTLHR